MTKEDAFVGCGISYLWMTAADDPFGPACAWHDKAYAEGSTLKSMGVTQQFVDSHFLEMMLKIAGEDEWLKFRAHMYASIVSLVGKYFWEDKVAEIPAIIKVAINELELNLFNVARLVKGSEVAYAIAETTRGSTKNWSVFA